MKQAKIYETKIRKLMKAMPKTSEKALERGNPVSTLIEGILSANTTAARASKAMAMLEKEYVDYNELRVSPDKDIIETLGRDYPGAAEKAGHLQTVLGSLYAVSCNVSMDYLEGKAKRELQRALEELGLDEYSCAYAMLFIFGLHRIPVDRDLAEILEMDDLVHPGSTIGEIQKVIERVVGKTSAVSAHAFLRSYVQKKAKALDKKRKAEEKVRAEAEARAEAERVAAEKEAAAKAALKARKAEEAAAKKAAKEAARKKAAKKTAKKTKKKVAAKPARKAVKKAVKKTVKKKAVAKKVARKTAKKKTGRK